MNLKSSGWGYKKVYKYDENGNLVEELTYSPDGKELRVTVLNTYDSNGNLIEVIDKGKYSNSTTHILYKYDAQGNMIEKLRTDDSDYQDWWRTLKKFDSFGNEIENIEYKAEDTEYSRTLYIYDKYSNLIETKYSYPDGRATNYTRSITYDSNGNPTQIDKSSSEYPDRIERYIIDIVYR